MACEDRTLERRRAGFTLFELVIVMMILGLLLVLAIPRYNRGETEARLVAAGSDLATLRDALLGRGEFPGYLADMERIPGFIPVNPLAGEERFEALNLRGHVLLCPSNLQSRSEIALWTERGLALPPSAQSYDPGARRGWRGPYVRGGREVSTTGAAELLPTLDGEGNLIPAPYRPRIGRFPGPEERRFEADRTFLERGFYTTNAIWSGASPYGYTGEYALADPWGNPYVLQIPLPSAFPPRMRPGKRFDRDFARLRWHYARWVSAGPDGVLDTPRDLFAGRVRESIQRRGDDLVLFLNRPDIYEEVE